MNKIKPYTKNLLLVLFIMMMIGLLFSRALLSISTALWVVFFLFSVDKERLKTYKPLLIWSSVPIVLFLLGWYQQITAKANYDFLLTLMIYPVAACATIALKSSNQKPIKAWIIFAVASLVYPISIYIFQFAEWNVLYGQGQSLPTLMNGDHIRYGLFLNVSLLLVLFIENTKPKIRLLLAGILIVAIVVMSVRTAWIALLICLISFLFFSKPKIKFSRWLLLLIIPLFVAAYFLFPAVSKKIKYTIYDWQTYQPTTYNADFSDGARRTVNFVAWKAIEEDNAVGWAAVPSTLNATFNKYFTGQKLTYGWPFNQWLYWCLGSGWVGAFLFTIWLLYPAYYGFRKKNYFLFTWSSSSFL